MKVRTCCGGNFAFPNQIAGPSNGCCPPPQQAMGDPWPCCQKNCISGLKIRYKSTEGACSAKCGCLGMNQLGCPPPPLFTPPRGVRDQCCGPPLPMEPICYSFRPSDSPQGQDSPDQSCCPPECPEPVTIYFKPPPNPMDLCAGCAGYADLEGKPTKLEFKNGKWSPVSCPQISGFIGGKSIMPDTLVPWIRSNTPKFEDMKPFTSLTQAEINCLL